MSLEEVQAKKVEKSKEGESSLFDNIGSMASQIGDFIRDLYSLSKGAEEGRGKDPQKLENGDKSLEKKNDSQGKIKSEIWDQVP